MEAIEADIVLDDAPEAIVEENKTGTKIADNDSQTPEDGIAELKSMLEQEKKLRLEAESRAHQAQQTVQKAAVEIQDSNLIMIKGAMDNVKQGSEALKRSYSEAMTVGDYNAAANIQEQMSINAAKMLQLQNGKDALEEKLKNPRPQTDDPVERITSQLSPRSASWIRQHPEVVRDRQMYEDMVRAHNHAVGEGHVLDSDAYFQHIEMRLGMRKPLRNTQEDGEEVTLSVAAAPTQRRTAPAAAPTTRTASGTPNNSQVVRLSSEMREMASMMGMSPEDYAKNMVALKREGKLN
jgi:hypothetical protein